MATPTTTTLFHTTDYRGATIEDLNIPQAISVNPTTPTSDALAIGFENEFTFLPVIHEVNKRLLGVIDLGANGAKVSGVVLDHMMWFNQGAKRKYLSDQLREQQDAGSTKGTTGTNQRTSATTKILKPRGKRYSVLTPLSPLEDLAGFFNRGNYFAIVTNDAGLGNFVYGVVTPEDLMKYEQSRPKL
ncbi:uncharacterized protein LODBEIA_P36800 [Lodderomyces beijingensis]|uniref:CBS domain-containing protein n=1 Tax=Lodderomyces beijingensis TaxID=1775926 RepID=A0ABP0ZQV6_9ASCO